MITNNFFELNILLIQYVFHPSFNNQSLNDDGYVLKFLNSSEDWRTDRMSIDIDATYFPHYNWQLTRRPKKLRQILMTMTGKSTPNNIYLPTRRRRTITTSKLIHLPTIFKLIEYFHNSRILYYLSELCLVPLILIYSSVSQHNDIR